MCELLGFNSKFPTQVTFSLSTFAQRGGDTGPHKDGWGIAFALDGDFRIIKEARAAVESEWVPWVRSQSIHSQLVLSHIRLATHPPVQRYSNTHPFQREFMGRSLVFAHNGKAPWMLDRREFPLTRYFPIGSTDSESAFCWLLERFAERIRTPEEYHFRILEEVILEASPTLLGDENKFNFLLSDGEVLFAHGGHRLYTTHRTCHCKDWSLRSEDLCVLLTQGPEQEVTLVATQPLTESETWDLIQPGELRMFSKGTRL